MSAHTDPPAASTTTALTRRRLLGTTTAGATGFALSGLLGRAPRVSAQQTAPVVSRGNTKIVVLGSQGGQQITKLTGANVRCGTSVLIDVGGEVTIVDCGVGSLHRLVQAGYDASSVRNVLVTHHHQDHNADLGNFAGFAWSSGRNEGDPNRRLDIYGPEGTTNYAEGYQLELKSSISDQENALGQDLPFAEFARWHEFDASYDSTTDAFSDGSLRVSATRVHHGSITSVAYRIRTADVDIVLSGDRGTEGQDEFIAFAKGADLLFHEIIDRKLIERFLRDADPAYVNHLLNDHSDPATVGGAATGAGVPVLVLYHLVPGNPAITDRRWKSMVSPYYGGQIIVAKDLLVV